MTRVFVLTATAIALLEASVLQAGAAEPPAQPQVRFGCQARTFGAGVYKNESEFLSVVRQVGEVGFEGLETNWKNLERYFDRPADFAAVLQSAHLKLIGAHMGGSPWSAKPREEVLDEVASAARFVKHMDGQYIVFSGSVPKARPLPADTWSKMAEFLDDIGRVCRANGVGCLYHNHWADCEAGGLEELCRRTDPQRVGFALDTGHALHAGKDPAALAGVLGKRLGLIHFADYSDQGPSNVRRPPLGEGCLDIPALVEALRKTAYDGWIVLEEETASAAGRPLAENGLAVFQKAFGLAK